MPVLARRDGCEVRLAYCTNVHPGETLAAIELALETYAARVRAHVSPDRPMGVGLWLAAPVAAELAAEPALARRLRERLAALGLVAFTLNAFPYGGFHAARVKEAVYRPSWLEEARVRFTLDAARALAALLPDGVAEGTISTLPLAWGADFAAAGATAEPLAAARFREALAGLEALRIETGKRIRLLIEPEPGCAIETTAGAIAFFARLGPSPHAGVCFDCCHQAVVGEDLAASLRALREAGIAVGKIHISSAIEGPLADMAPFVEPRWLHQVFETTPGRRADDLERVAGDPAWRGARVRVHFHAPVYAERLAGGLATTRRALVAALEEAISWDRPPDLEVETYTWEVLPPAERPGTLADGIAREMRFVLDFLAERGIQ